MRRIKQIVVTKLFGMFDYTIPLNLNENITIIHGPNGMGKTILLNMIYDFPKNNWDIFYRVPFQEFRIAFDDGAYVAISRVSLDANRSLIAPKPDEYFELLCSYRLAGGNHEHFYIQRKENPAGEHKDIGTLIETLTQKIKGLTFRASSGSFYIRSREYFPFDIIEEYSGLLSLSEKQQLVFFLSRPSIAFSDLLSSVTVQFIRTQRLVTPKKSTDQILPPIKETNLPESSVVSSVMLFSNELAEIMLQKNNEYAALAQKLDSTFPNRVISQSPIDKPARSYEDLRLELVKLEEKRTLLHQVGLLDQTRVEFIEEVPDLERRQHVASVLEIYLGDTQEKLSVFDDIAQRIKLMMDIINKRFSFKKFNADRNKGFVITLDNGHQLSPADLSSGEQHEIVLAYELLFNVQPGSLILVDEPEISLHIGWQEELLKDLLTVADLRDFYILLATHSPVIVGGRWDLTIDLAGEGQDESDNYYATDSSADNEDVNEPHDEKDDREDSDDD